MNPSKAKGTAAETLVAAYLQAKGFRACERRTLQGSKDRGDIAGIMGLVVEVKAEKAISLAGYMKELEAEMENDKADTGVAIVKKRGTLDVGEWYAVLPVKTWLALYMLATDWKTPVIVPEPEPRPLVEQTATD